MDRYFAQQPITQTTAGAGNLGEGEPRKSYGATRPRGIPAAKTAVGIMITLGPITERNTFVFKNVRLRALQDSPHAFGATYTKESQLPESDWIKRLERMNGASGVGFLALDKDDGTACGIAGSFLDANDRTRAQLI